MYRVSIILSWSIVPVLIARCRVGFVSVVLAWAFTLCIHRTSIDIHTVEKHNIYTFITKWWWWCPEKSQSLEDFSSRLLQFFALSLWILCYIFFLLWCAWSLSLFIAYFFQQFFFCVQNSSLFLFFNVKILTLYFFEFTFLACCSYTNTIIMPHLLPFDMRFGHKCIVKLESMIYLSYLQSANLCYTSFFLQNINDL